MRRIPGPERAKLFQGLCRGDKMTEASLIVKKLNFCYRDREDLVIKDITFQANPEEILLIAGASE